MAWGVLDDPYMVFPPGTVNLKDASGGDDYKGDTKGLKKKGNIVLQPQPSDSPNDPLNWSQLWKYANMLILCFGSGITTAISPMPTPGLPLIAEQYGVPLDLVTPLVVGSLNFYTALISFFVTSAGLVWGKRPQYVISVVLLCAAQVWAYQAKSFPSLVAARTITGIASAPLFSLVAATITDMFFVHERGLMLAIWNLMLGAGGQLGQIIGGVVIEKLGMPIAFAFTGIAYAVLLPGVYFIALETGYPAREVSAVDVIDSKTSKLDDENELIVKVAEIEPKRTYGNQLAVFPGRLSNASFWKGSLKPIAMIVFPDVFFSTIIFTTYWILMLALPIMAATLLSMPPYNLTPSQIGLTNLPPLVVSIVAALLAGLIADSAVKSMAARNTSFPGFFEPEFRLLPLMLIATPIGVTGIVGFGISLRDSLPLPWVLTFLSIYTFAATFGNQAALSYAVDCHPNDSAQAFTIISSIAAATLFVITTVMFKWYFAAGPGVVFGTLAVVILFASGLSIPMYIFGKRLRSATARTGYTRRLMA
ncbi:MFS general substrate transporter [Zopfia rhizophila CBS 207.26]|uniref:MFS general substrate transporter n=1 Tax=Zopfia rhizophila CBS 207.26 TaxID=1314779 RepID=A0A6A6EPP9_9PEZI|nr:MFS general substrate transporter [Zopfia rhizophila CBS 207.26]